MRLPPLLVVMLAAGVGGGAMLGAYHIGHRDGLQACPAAAEASIERDRLYYEWVRSLPDDGGE